MVALTSCQISYRKSADGTVTFSANRTATHIVSGHMTGNGDFFPDVEYHELIKSVLPLENHISVWKKGSPPLLTEDIELHSIILEGWAAPEYWRFRKKYLPNQHTYMGYGQMNGLATDPCVFTYVTIEIKPVYISQSYEEKGLKFTNNKYAWVCVRYISIKPPKPNFIQKILHEYSERQSLHNDYRYKNGAFSTEKDRGRIVAGDLWMYRPYQRQLMLEAGNAIGAQCFDDAKKERDKQ